MIEKSDFFLFAKFLLVCVCCVSGSMTLARCPSNSCICSWCVICEGGSACQTLSPTVTPTLASFITCPEVLQYFMYHTIPLTPLCINQHDEHQSGARQPDFSGSVHCASDTFWAAGLFSYGSVLIWTLIDWKKCCRGTPWHETPFNLSPYNSSAADTKKKKKTLQYVVV